MKRTYIHDDAPETLRDAMSRWQELSENPNATWCMTDHCHDIVSEVENIAGSLEAIFALIKAKRVDIA